MLKDRISAFDYDSLRSSHALSLPEEDVESTYEIDDLFDLITFNKVKHRNIVMKIIVYNLHSFVRFYSFSGDINYTNVGEYSW